LLPEGLASSVYGDIPTLPKREDMVPHPLSPYAVTKLAGPSRRTRISGFFLFASASRLWMAAPE